MKVSGISVGEIKNLFDNSKDTVLRVVDNINSFIIFDFKNKKVSISKYYLSVPSSLTGYNGNRPKTWDIEGSNDLQNWEIIDQRANDSSLSDYGRSKTFNVNNNNNNKYFKYIRIKEIISQNGNHQMLLSEIEFYGSYMID